MSEFIRWLLEALAVLAFLLLSVGAVAGVVVLRDWWQWRQRGQGGFFSKGLFVGRKPLDAQQFHERFFQQRGVPAYVTVRLRELLEEKADGDLLRLWPTDELSYFVDIEAPDEDFVRRVEEEFYIRIGDDEAEDLSTFEDLVNLVWSKVSDARGDSAPTTPAAE